MYQSTRSNYSTDSLNAVLKGIAPDGGLFINPDIDKSDFGWQLCIKQSPLKMFEMILSYLLPDFEDMSDLVHKAYSGKFQTSDITPLVKVGSDYVLELFRGPTSAFKDVALSMLPQLITQARKQTGTEDKIVILTATSGDTGKAALQGFHDVDGTRIIVFYPDNGVSLVQKTQMVTQEGNNVNVCAVRGNFDDCQTGVKKAFASISSKIQGTGVVLSSANSINIGRLAPQVVYYFIAYKELVENGRINLNDKVNFVVPTGNFGDILAGYFAKLMGLPVDKLVCAANKNNVLADFITTGTYDKNRPLYKTQSPSMDILVSSNLERLLFLACGKDTEKVAAWMNDLSQNGRFTVDDLTLSYIRKSFSTGFCTEEESSAAIKTCWDNNHYLCDPHTAVAYHVAKKLNVESPCVILSTASAYKFPQAVLSALNLDVSCDEFEMMNRLYQKTGVEIPVNLADLKGKKAIYNSVIDKEGIESFILKDLKLWK